jgi:hypothetical protein
VWAFSDSDATKKICHLSKSFLGVFVSPVVFSPPLSILCRLLGSCAPSCPLSHPPTSHFFFFRNWFFCCGSWGFWLYFSLLLDFFVSLGLGTLLGSPGCRRRVISSVGVVVLVLLVSRRWGPSALLGDKSMGGGSFIGWFLSFDTAGGWCCFGLVFFFFEFVGCRGVGFYRLFFGFCVMTLLHSLISSCVVFASSLGFSSSFVSRFFSQWRPSLSEPKGEKGMAGGNGEK